MSQTQSESRETSTMTVEPHKQHRWLQKLVGEWTYETGGPTGQPAMKATAGKLRFVLPTRLGEVKLVGDVPESLVRDVLEGR